MKNKIQYNFNIEKSILFINNLIDKLETDIKYKKAINEDFHNKIIDFCVIICNNNKNYYKKIDIDFRNYQSVKIEIFDYSKNKNVKRKINKNEIFDLMSEELLVLKRIHKFIKLKKYLKQ